MQISRLPLLHVGLCLPFDSWHLQFGALCFPLVDLFCLFHDNGLWSPENLLQAPFPVIWTHLSVSPPKVSPATTHGRADSRFHSGLLTVPSFFLPLKPGPFKQNTLRKIHLFFSYSFPSVRAHLWVRESQVPWFEWVMGEGLEAKSVKGVLWGQQGYLFICSTLLFITWFLLLLQPELELISSPFM